MILSFTLLVMNQSSRHLGAHNPGDSDNNHSDNWDSDIFLLTMLDYGFKFCNKRGCETTYRRRILTANNASQVGILTYCFMCQNPESMSILHTLWRHNVSTSVIFSIIHSFVLVSTD